MISENSVLNTRYRLEKKIGQGGFARVYSATDLILERQVAVKILHAELSDDGTEDFLERFGREAKAVAAFDHPNILTVYDYGQAEGTAYLVMPFVEGGTLHDKLRREKKLSLTQAAHYLQQAAAALDYAHRRNIVHRDIKPQNMLLRSEDDRLLLADFGIAKVLSSTSSQSRTGAIGTLSYMSPEQLSGAVGRGTDIYALGCVLFLMLTGQLPYLGPTEQVVMGHLSGPIPSLVERSQGQLPSVLQIIIERALAKKPEDRFQSAGELASTFNALVYENGARPISTTSGSLAVGDTEATQAIVTPPRPATPTRPHDGGAPNTQPAAPFLPVAPVNLNVVANPSYATNEANEVSEATQLATGPTPPVARPGSPIVASSTSNSLTPKKPNWLLIGGAGVLAALVVMGGIVALVLSVPRPANNTATSANGQITPRQVILDQSAREYTRHIGEVSSLALTSDNKMLATGSFDNSLILWEVVTGRFIRSFNGHTDKVRSVAFSRDDKTLASAAEDNTVRLWEVATGSELKKLSGHNDHVKSVAFSPDGKQLASASFDNTVRLWEVASGNLIKTLQGPKQGLSSVAFSADGKIIAAGGEDNTIWLWNVNSGNQIANFATHTEPIQMIAFSPNGKTLASASKDQTIKLWDVELRTELRTLTGHTDVVLSVAFSPDGQTLVSGSADETVKLWDVPSGQEQQTLTGHAGAVWQVLFTSDSRYLVSGSADSKAKLWQLQSGPAIGLNTTTVATTAAPTTVAPTTAASATTLALTTSAPTTAAPPTEAPTTAPAPPLTTVAPPPAPTTAPPVTLNPEAIARARAALNNLPGNNASFIILPDGRTTDNNGNRQLPAASTIKLWIAATVLEEAKAGRLNLADSITINRAQVAGGTGVLQNRLGQAFTIEQILNITLVSSDNTGANILLDKLGGFDKVNAYAQRNGYSQTKIQRRLGDVNNSNNNFTSARDGATFMQRLLRGEIVDKVSSDRVLAALQERRSYNADQNFFGTRLPPNVGYLHISGTGAGTRNEIGYIVTNPASPTPSDSALIIAILASEVGNEQAAENTIATAILRISQAF